jgi:hypothetical protein
MAESHIEFTRAQFSHHIVPGQAVKQFTSTSCFHIHKELKLLYMPVQRQRYSANDRRKDFMISHNKSDLRRPGIELRSPDSQSNAQPIELTGQLFDYLPYLARQFVPIVAPFKICTFIYGSSKSDAEKVYFTKSLYPLMQKDSADEFLFQVNHV